ncbi:MAG: hypothetical protein KDK63_02650, partial [Chlamydiia bacterium]|nr:hypothetical protein [Chlamydiia bacterium]
IRGTPGYSIEHNTLLREQHDYYSFACIVYTLATGKMYPGKPSQAQKIDNPHLHDLLFNEIYGLLINPFAYSSVDEILAHLFFTSN